MVTVLITGGTGLVGQLIRKKLSQKGYQVRVLTRSPKKSNEYAWNIANKTIDEKVFENLDYIIHLAGAGIADKRWTKKRKQEIIDSRTKSTQLLLTKIQELKINLKGFIAASAIGYYGAITSEKIFIETDKPANDFLGNVCYQWEQNSLKFQQENIPTTILRIGIVLCKNGGALSKMNTPLFIAPVASGKQFIPWIHIEDLSSLFIKAIEDFNFTGIYNAVAPDLQTSKSFSKTLALKSKKLFIPIGVPKFVLQILYGEMAIILSTGSKISAKKTIKSRFHFKYKDLNKALDAIYS